MTTRYIGPRTMALGCWGRRRRALHGGARVVTMVVLSVVAVAAASAALIVQHTRSIRSAKEAQPLGPSDGIIWRVTHANLLGEQGDYAKAAALWEDIVRDYASTEIAAEALLFLGGVHEAAHDYKEAEAAYDRLRAEYPRSSWSRGAEFRLRALRNPTRREVPLADDPVVAEFCAATKLQKANQYDGAAQGYEALARIHPSHEFAPLALLSAGYCYFLADRPADARMRWNQVLEIYPDSSYSADADFALRAVDDPRLRSAFRQAIAMPSSVGPSGSD